MAMLSPGSGPGTSVSGRRVTVRCAMNRGGHLGLSCAAPAIIGVRVPEAYVAIMELKGHLRI